MISPIPANDSPPIPQKSEFSSGKWDMGRHSTTVFRYEANDAQGFLYKTKHLFDSNRLSVWMTEISHDPDWVLVDFGEKRLMNRIEVEIPTWALGEGLEYKIQVLAWGKWRTLYHITNVEKKNVHIIKGMDASIVRLYFPKKRKSYTAVSDFRVYLGNSLLTGTDSRLTKNKFPIHDGLIPDNPAALPGAPRTYRNGYHKGIDIYETGENLWEEKKKLTFATKILSIQSGRIVRIDSDYLPMRDDDFEKQKALTKKYPVTYVDRDFGGRQIWIDHGNGILSAYNHMSSIREDIKLGQFVKKGELIGTAGNSGLKQEAEGSEENVHLHLEIWIDGEYMGKGLTAQQSLDLLKIFFAR